MIIVRAHDRDGAVGEHSPLITRVQRIDGDLHGKVAVLVRRDRHGAGIERLERC